MIDTIAETTHQSHKADADADIPHLNSFISGPRQKEGARFSTLLALENRVTGKMWEKAITYMKDNKIMLS